CALGRAWRGQRRVATGGRRRVARAGRTRQRLRESRHGGQWCPLVLTLRRDPAFTKLAVADHFHELLFAEGPLGLARAIQVKHLSSSSAGKVACDPSRPQLTAPSVRGISARATAQSGGSPPRIPHAHTCTDNSTAHPTAGRGPVTWRRSRARGA